jgi:uncharacterized protein YecE (DUF72 family)
LADTAKNAVIHKDNSTFFIGTAGWNIPVQYLDLFPRHGSHLERYSAVMNAVEINSSFYHPHRRTTYERWAACTPKAFRFSVKLPKTITHEARLADYGGLLDRFCSEVEGLGQKLAVLLVQLPPCLAFNQDGAAGFFRDMRKFASGAIACEPRHASWFTSEANDVFEDLRIARVAADPPRDAQDGTPGGWNGLAYYRKHGNPKIYYSSYDGSRLTQLAGAMRETTSSSWCIFDNTAAFAALGNALALRELTNRTPNIASFAV